MSNETVLHTFGGNTDFVASLQGFGATFLIVGGLAVKYFCPEREVDDLDLMIDPTLENAERVIRALDRYCPGHGVRAASLAGPGKQLPVKMHLYLDILTPRVETPDFGTIYKTAIRARLDQIDVLLPSLASLLTLKRHAADTDIDPERREKHRKDVVCLETLAV